MLALRRAAGSAFLAPLWPCVVWLNTVSSATLALYWWTHRRGNGRPKAAKHEDVAYRHQHSVRCEIPRGKQLALRPGNVVIRKTEQTSCLFNRPSWPVCEDTTPTTNSRRHNEWKVHSRTIFGRQAMPKDNGMFLYWLVVSSVWRSCRQIEAVSEQPYKSCWSGCSHRELAILLPIVLKCTQLGSLDWAATSSSLNIFVF